jgi:hypothetical protein
MQTTHIVESFVATSREYCELIEGIPVLPRRSFLVQVQRTLARLYVLALDLPSVPPETNDLPLERLSAQDWRHLHERLGEYLGAADVYWMVFDPADPIDHEAIAQTLADDLSDIYRDLRDCAVEVGGTMTGDLLWTLRFSFESHWGHHVVGTLMAIHSLLYGSHAITD